MRNHPVLPAPLPTSTPTRANLPCVNATACQRATLRSPVSARFAPASTILTPRATQSCSTHNMVYQPNHHCYHWCVMMSTLTSSECVGEFLALLVVSFINSTTCNFRLTGPDVWSGLVPLVIVLFLVVLLLNRICCPTSFLCQISNHALLGCVTLG